MKEEILEYFKDINHAYNDCTRFDTLKRMLGELEPKTGHWIPVEYPTGVEAFGVKEMTAVALKCSECGEKVDISDGDFKLCPYCGTKMQ